MRLLALDTSTEYLSLALLVDGRSYVRALHAGQTHSQRILPLLRELLTEAGVEMTDLQGIAFGAGPGSFTGLRIGCGVAQGLAFGVDLPVVGVSTLLALANGDDAGQSGSARVIACLDARMGEVYHAAYARDGDNWREVQAPGLYKPEQVPALEGAGWTGIGSGWAAYSETLHAAYSGQVEAVFAQAYPHALAIAELAVPMFAAGLGVPAAEAAPIYIRNKVALKTSERAAGMKFN